MNKKWISFIWKYWFWEILTEPKYIKTKRVVDAKCLICNNIYQDIWFYWIIDRKNWCTSCAHKSITQKKMDVKYEKYIGWYINSLKILGFWEKQNLKNWKKVSTFDCKCFCWKEFNSLIWSILRNHTRSCWCLKTQESPMRNKIHDLVWLSFWKLILIWEDTEYNKQRNKSKSVKKYIFECDCKNKRKISSPLFDVKNWFTVSCWCLRSQQQIDFGNFLASLWVEFKENDKSLWFEIDFFIEEYNLWIEYNGVRWHSMDKKLKNKYSKHNIKKRKAYEKWINLIYIWEDQRLNKRNIIESMIKNKLWLSKKIYARKCQIVEISQSEFNNFCETNHIQWKTINTKNRYWLQYNWNFVSVMWFREHELNRFCSILWYNVIWWFNKLLNYHIKKSNPNKIISFADYDVVAIDNNIYSKSWFILEGKEDISYFYVKIKKKELTRYHKSLFRKEKITEKFWYKFKEWETEFDAMDNLWFFRCYNSWIQKYVLHTW